MIVVAAAGMLSRAQSVPAAVASTFLILISVTPLLTTVPLTIRIETAQPVGTPGGMVTTT